MEIKMVQGSDGRKRRGQASSEARYSIEAKGFLLFFHAGD